MTPKISIIIPVYNVEKYLRECLDSIIAQSFTDWECILVDDGSKDNSPAICDEYFSRDNRFRVIHTTNGGQGRARNLGLNIMRGEYVTFIDADDLIHDCNTHENCLRIMDDDPTIDIVQYSYVIFNDSCAIPQITQKPALLLTGAAEIYEHFGLINYRNDRIIYPGPCFKIYRSSLFVSIRFPEGRIYEDAWMLADIFEITNKFLIIDCGCYAYRHHETSTTHSNASENKARQRFEMYSYVFQKLICHSRDLRSHNKLFWAVMLKLVMAKILFGNSYGKDIASTFAKHFPKCVDNKQRLQVCIAKIIGLNTLLNIKATSCRLRHITHLTDL